MNSLLNLVAFSPLKIYILVHKYLFVAIWFLIKKTFGLIPKFFHLMVYKIQLFSFLRTKRKVPNSLLEVTHEFKEGSWVKKNSSKAGYAFEDFLEHKVLPHYYPKVMRGIHAKKTDYYPLHMREKGNDFGVDFVCESDSEIKLIQAKLYSSKLKKELISTSAMTLAVFTAYYASIGVNKRVTFEIITNSSLDGSAMAYAQSMGIYCTNGDDLNRILTDINN